MDDKVFLLIGGGNHVQKDHRVRRGWAVPSPPTRPSNKKSYGSKCL